MNKLLSTLTKLKLSQKLMLLVIFLGLLPCIGMIVWGVGIAIKSPEFMKPDWAM